METLLYLVGGVANLVAIAGGAVAAVFICWAGIQWMMSSGDPQKISMARSSVIGVLVGLILIGSSFLIPDAVNQRLLRPATGVSLEGVVGIDCDRELRRQLVNTRTANNAERMNRLVQRIQASREGCHPEAWAPVVIDAWSATYVLGMGSATNCSGPEIGKTDVPRGLQTPGGGDNVRNSTARDAQNNIFMMFHAGYTERPSDGARCWLYSSRLKIWDREF